MPIFKFRSSGHQLTCYKSYVLNWQTRSQCKIIRSKSKKMCKSHVHLTIITAGFSKSSNVEGQDVRSTVSISDLRVQKYLQKETTGLNMFVTDCRHLISIRRHVCLGKKTTKCLVAAHDLTHPPVRIFLVENWNNVAAFQLEFLVLLWLEVVTGNHFWLKYTIQSYTHSRNTQYVS